MNEVREWFENIVKQLPNKKNATYDDAMSMKRWKDAKKALRNCKHDFDGGFSGSAEDHIYAAFNAVIEDTLHKLGNTEDNQEINHDRK